MGWAGPHSRSTIELSFFHLSTFGPGGFCVPPVVADESEAGHWFHLLFSFGPVGLRALPVVFHLLAFYGHGSVTEFFNKINSEFIISFFIFFICMYKVFLHQYSPEGDIFPPTPLEGMYFFLFKKFFLQKLIFCFLRPGFSRGLSNLS